MTRLLMLILLVLSFCALIAGAASLPFFPCLPNMPAGMPGCTPPADSPPPIQLDSKAPKPCASTDTDCIKNYTQQQTNNYQSGVTNPSLVNPVTGGAGCAMSDAANCNTQAQTWNSGTVTPITTEQVPYQPGARPEIDQLQQQQNCQSDYDAFSRTTTQNCQ